MVKENVSAQKEHCPCHVPIVADSYLKQRNGATPTVESSCSGAPLDGAVDEGTPTNLTLVQIKMHARKPSYSVWGLFKKMTMRICCPWNGKRRYRDCGQ